MDEELREGLNKRSLSSGGNKSVLRQRLKEATPGAEENVDVTVNLEDKCSAGVAEIDRLA